MLIKLLFLHSNYIKSLLIFLRREKRKGGGVLIFVRNDWVSERLETTFISAEVIALSIYKQNTSFTICAVYRPPALNVTSFCEESSCFLRMFNNNRNLVLAGGFNIDCKDNSGHGSSEYLNILAEFGLTNTITDYTREEYLGDDISRSCIDHIIVRSNELRILSGVIKQKVADHYFVTITLLHDGSVQNFRTEDDIVFILNNKNIGRPMQAHDWNLLAEYDYIIIYQHLVGKFQNIHSDSKRERKSRKRKDKNVWINRDIMELCYSKDKLWARYKQNLGNLRLKEEFRKMRNRVTARVRLAKKI